MVRTSYASGLRNPFRFPRPGIMYQKHPVFGDPDDTWHTRTPAQAHEVMLRRVDKWFSAKFKHLPRGLSREDMVARVFGDDGWQVRARVADVSGHRPHFGWLLTHPQDGYIVFADKSRDGDLGEDYVAPKGGPFGGYPRLTWGDSLTGLFEQTPSSMQPIHPARRTTSTLLAHAFRTAPQPERDTVSFLLALSGYDLPEFLATVAADDLSISHA